MDRSMHSSDRLSKSIGVLSYLTPLGLLVAMVMNRHDGDRFVSHHIRQSAGLWVTALVLTLIGFIPYLGWLVSAAGALLLMILWIAGIVNAMGGRDEPVPILGQLYIKWHGIAEAGQLKKEK